MGIAYAGHCYKDAPAVLAAFKLGFPYVENNIAVSLTSATNSNTLITATVSYQPFSSAAAASRALNIPTAACTETMSSMDLQFMFFVVALVFAFFTGFRSSFRP